MALREAGRGDPAQQGGGLRKRYGNCRWSEDGAQRGRDGSHLSPASCTRERPLGGRPSSTHPGDTPASQRLCARLGLARRVPSTRRRCFACSPGSCHILLPPSAEHGGGTPGPQEAGGWPGCSSSREAGNADPITGTHMYVRTHAHTVHAQTWAQPTYTHTHTCAHTCSHSACMLTCTHTHTRALHSHAHMHTRSHSTHMFVCMCACTCTHTNTHAHTLTCTHMRL